nr:nitrate/nitrite transporter NrtS [Aliiglaciecola lipolytica]
MRFNKLFNNIIDIALYTWFLRTHCIGVFKKLKAATLQHSLLQKVTTVFTAKQLKTAIFISIVVGTILTLINQGEAFLGEAEIIWFKVILTYIVPFCVSMYSSSVARLDTKPIEKTKPLDG